MADTPSSILLLRLQATGSNTNLWGGYLNTALSTLERAAKGYQAYSATGSTTITWANYSASNDFAVAFAKINSSGLSAAYTLTLPSQQTFFGAWNNTSYAGTLKNSGGTGIAVPANRRALLYGDATDIGEAAPNWLSSYANSLDNAGDIIVKSTMVSYVASALASATGGTGGFWTVYTFNAVGGETSFSGADASGNTLAYIVGTEFVTLNGVKLVSGTDYAAGTGTSITGLAALTAGDVLEVVAVLSFSVANTYTQAQVNALFASPPTTGYGSTTPRPVAATTLSASGQSTLATTQVSTLTVTQQAVLVTTQVSTFTVTQHATLEGVTSTGATGTGKLVYDTAPTVSTLTVSSGGAAITGNSTVTGTLGISGTSSLGTGSTNWITAAGSGTNPTIGTSAGNLVAAPNAGEFIVSHATSPDLVMLASGGAADQKRWDWSVQSTLADFRAVNDADSGATVAYRLTRGTTYNVASHTWYTSTVAGTPVATLALSMGSAKTNLTGTWPTSSAGLATGTLWSNAGVINVA